LFMRLNNQPPNPINKQGFHLWPRIMRSYQVMSAEWAGNTLRPGEASLGS
jgi:hypothetical protein